MECSTFQGKKWKWTHRCTMDRLGAVHHTSVQWIDYIIPPHQCTMDRMQFPCTTVQWTAVPQDWLKLDRLQFPKTGVQWTDCSSPKLVYNGQTAVPQDWCTKDRLHLAHTCTYDAWVVIKEAEASGEMQQCRLLLQQQVGGNAAVSVAVTTAGRGKCSSVGCCYNSRSGEMQQCRLLLQQQVGGNAAVSVAVTTAGRGKCSSVGCCYNSRSGEMQQCRLLLQQQCRLLLQQQVRGCKCRLLLQQQVRGNAAVSVAVTTAGQGGKCSSVSCCYNSRSGEIQQCQLLL